MQLRKDNIIKTLRFKRKMGLSTCILFFFTCFISNLFAAQYNHIYQFEAPDIITLSNGRQIVKINGTQQKDDIVGAPILPVKTSKIFIPANEEVSSTEIIYGTLRTIDGTFNIQHVTTPQPTTVKETTGVEKPASDIYETNALYPSVIYKSRAPQFLNGVKVVLVDLMPILYNPVEGQLKYYVELEVRITTEIQNKPGKVMPYRNSLKDKEKILNIIDNKNDFKRLYQISENDLTARVLSASKDPSAAADTRQYVVITTPELAPAFQVLTAHRASSAGGGFTTYIEYIDEIDAVYSGIDLPEKMRNFIRDMYTNYGTQYVVLGGDCDGPLENQVIPTRGCYAQVGDYTDANIPSDLYFGCLDGSWNFDGDERWGETNDGIDGGDIDWFSEVYVGRIPADNFTEAMNQINKIISFETHDSPTKILFTGEELESSTWGGDRMDWLYSFMGSTPKTTLYDRNWGENNWPKSQLLKYINSNQYYNINYSGHSTNFSDIKLNSNDIYAMTNNKYFFVYSQGCYAGSIDGLDSDNTYKSTDSFGEVVTNASRNGGAFAYIGNSRYSWYFPGSYVKGASNLAHKEFVEAITSGNITKIGVANQKSKTDLPLNSQLYRWIAFGTNLIGCPATDLSTLPLFASSYENNPVSNVNSPDSGTPVSTGGGGGGGCFIATAAYGSLIEPHVKILRDFRDRFLITNLCGQSFVKFYYKYSPPLADFIAKHDILRLMVRMTLIPLVGISWVALKFGIYPAISMILLFGIGLARLTKLRKKCRA